jgi:hypothetical protein
MKRVSVTVIKKTLGMIEHNDGEFVEVQNIGIEGIETGLHLDRVQIQRSDTEYNRRDFLRRFKVGGLLDVCTTLRVAPTSKTGKQLKQLERDDDTEQERFEGLPSSHH